jgi:hypothetical protein
MALICGKCIVHNFFIIPINKKVTIANIYICILLLADQHCELDQHSCLNCSQLQKKSNKAGKFNKQKWGDTGCCNFEIIETIKYNRNNKPVRMVGHSNSQQVPCQADCNNIWVEQILKTTRGRKRSEVRCSRKQQMTIVHIN